MDDKPKRSSIVTSILIIAGIIGILLFLDTTVQEGIGLSVVFVGCLLLAIAGCVRFIRKNPSLWQTRRMERLKQQEKNNSEPGH